MAATSDDATDTLVGSNEAPELDPETGKPRGLKTLASDFTAVLSGRIASVALSFATVIITTRLLGPVGYGRLSYVIVVATLVFVSGSAWTGTALVRYGREAIDTTGTMRAAAWERLVIAIPALAVAGAVAFLVRAAGFMPKSLTWTLVVLAVGYGLVLALSDHVVYILQAVGKMKSSAFAVVLRQAVVVVGIGALWLLGLTVSPAIVVVVTIASWFVMGAVAGRSIWRSALWPPTFDSKLRRRMLSFSLPLIAFTVSQYVIATVDILVIASYRNDKQVGIYAIAYQGYTILQSVAMAMGVVLLPLFVSLRRAGREPLIDMFAERIVPQLTLLAGTLLGVLAPLMAFFVPLVLGKEFRQSAVPLVILLIPVALGVTCYLQAPIIVLHEKTRAVGLVSVLAALVNVVGDLVLIGPVGMGINGAAVSTAASLFVLVAGYSGITARCTRTPYPIKKIVVLVPLLVGTLASLALTGWVSAALIVASTCVVAVGLTFAGRIFERSDAELVSRLALPEPVRRILTRSIFLLSRS